MTCRILFEGAAELRKDLDAPVRLYPKCHPKASINVFVDSKTRSVVLSCSRCDRPVAIVKARKHRKKVK